MANTKTPNLLFLLFVLSWAAQIVQGSRSHMLNPYPQRVYQISVELQGGRPNKMEEGLRGNGRRVLIGSVAPTCTYNECRGCKYRCRAEQVPVEGNDPMNSAYHYKCICHR